MIEILSGNDNDTRAASLEDATTTYTCQTTYYYRYMTVRRKRVKHDP
jgi:hypothetical protein